MLFESLCVDSLHELQAGAGPADMSLYGAEIIKCSVEFFLIIRLSIH